MNIQDRRGMRNRAAAALSGASFHPGKLALIHTAAAAALSLVLTIINVILTDRIGETGGLGGVGMRSILTTAKSVLGIFSTVILPFWELGFIYAALKFSRGQRVELPDLLQGFRRFGPVLRLKLAEAVIYVILFMLSANIGSAIFMMTPFALPMMEAMQSLDPNTATPEVLMAAVQGSILPLYAVFGVVFGVLAIPVAYRFRMAQYVIVDTPATGALAALGTSNRLMRNNRMSLFRLDLSFWWYYGLQVLCTMIAYSDVIAELMGVSLPVSATAALFIAFGVYCAVRLVIAWLWASPVETTYAVAYDVLQEMQKDAEPRLFKNFPWDFLPERKEEQPPQ